MITGVVLATSFGCAKKDNKSDKSNSGPSASDVTPSDFRNEYDENGFKARLPQLSSVMQSSSTSFALNSNNGNKPKKALDIVSYDFNGRGQILLSGGSSGRYGKNILRSLAKTTNTLTGTNTIALLHGDDEDEDGDHDSDSDLLSTIDSVKEGDNCNQLLTDLNGNYDSAADSLEKLANTISTTDFSKVEGLTKDAPSAKEAVAYKFNKKSEFSEEDQESVTDSAVGRRMVPHNDDKHSGHEGHKVSIDFNSRFGGGANAKAISVSTTNSLDVNSAHGQARGSFAMNSYADTEAKNLISSLGFGVSAEPEGQKPVRFDVTFNSNISGGVEPALKFDVKANGSQDGKPQVVDVSFDLRKTSAEQMRFMINAVANERKTTRTILMKITPSTNLGDTCTVSKVTK